MVVRPYRPGTVERMRADLWAQTPWRNLFFVFETFSGCPRTRDPFSSAFQVLRLQIDVHHHIHHTLLEDLCYPLAFSHLPQELVCLPCLKPAGKAPGKDWTQDPDPKITAIFHVRTSHYFLVSPPSPERGVSEQLFTKIYYSIGGVRAGGQGRGMGPSCWRTKKTRLPPLRGPSKDI